MCRLRLRLAGGSVALLVVLTGLAGCTETHSQQVVTFSPCVTGETTSCVPPDAVVQFRPSVTETQIVQYAGNLFQTKAQVTAFHGSVVAVDYPRTRVLVSWPKAWRHSQQQAFMNFLASSGYVQNVTRA
jgi:hypothetical protein